MGPGAPGKHSGALKARTSPGWNGQETVWYGEGPFGGIQITRPSEGQRSSSWVWSIQVDRPGTRETVPDRFWLVPDDFLMKILTFLRKSRLFAKNNDMFEKVAPKIEVPAPRRARYGPALFK